MHGQRLRSQTHINSFGPFIATHRCEDRRIPESTLPSEPLCEALEDSNGRRRRNDESNALAGEFEMMRDLFVTRGNPTLQRASG